MTIAEKIEKANAIAELIGLMGQGQCADPNTCMMHGDCANCELDKELQYFVDFMDSAFPDPMDNGIVQYLYYDVLGGTSYDIVDEGDPYDYL